MAVDSALKQPSPSSGDENVLLLSTEKQVYGFDLLETFRVAIGRHDSNDLTFNSRNVSNYHAEILNEADGIVVRDMGSTNGTFVNEERVRRRKLQGGDRIRVGNYEITVRLTTADGAKEATPQAAAVPRQGSFRRADGGENGGMILKDLLLAVCKNEQAVKLVLTRNQNDEVVVYVNGGSVIFAEMGKAKAEKALYRAFEWYRGTFRLEPFPANDAVPRVMTIPIETLVEEGQQQAKDLEELIGKLPPPETTLRLRESCKMKICDFSPAEIEVFQGLIRHGNLTDAIEASVMTDLRVMSLTHALLRKKVFEVEESSALLEQTNIITRP